MNFASWTFVLLFLPLTIAGFQAIRGSGTLRLRILFLIVASLLFYGASGLFNLAVLAGSIGVNLMAGWLLTREPRDTPRNLVFWTAIAANIALLLGFKVHALLLPAPDGFRVAESILIPLALSFVTFQQIGFVTACYRRQIKTFAAPDYLFFALFFPQLVMGPILRFQDIAPQLKGPRALAPGPDDLAVGLGIFIFGLAQKVLLADQIAPTVDRLFAEAQSGPLAMSEAWYAVAGFQLQIYFDFAAYADMAIGLGRMFGIRLPINFDRPLFATDRFEWWRRWHISFVIFMRGHVFLPLVRRRRWPVPAALAVTGMLSGLWHGLGWTFIIWGLVHTAILLTVHERRKRHRAPPRSLRAARAIALTFAASMVIGVLFRSPTLASAGNLYGSLFGSLPLPPGEALLGPRALLMLPICALAAWGLPNSRQFFHRFWTAVDPRVDAPPTPAHPLSALAFALNARWAAAMAGLFVLCLMLLGDARRFIYVQF